MASTQRAETSKSSTMAPPPVKRLDHWTFVAKDQEKTVRFYTEILGAIEHNWESYGIQSGWIKTVNFAGTLIDIFPIGGPFQLVGQVPAGYHHCYIIDLEDYDKWVEHLRAHNVEILRQDAHGEIRLSLYFQDPDGNNLELSVRFDDDRQTGRREIEKRGLLKDPNFAPPWRRQQT